MALTPEDVARLAGLARIDLRPDELATLAPQLDLILESVARVGEIATPDVPPSSHPLAMSNVFRADTVRPSMAVDAALANAPATEDERFRVPRILGEEQ